MDVLEQPVSILRGVGPKKKQYLRAAGIETIRDLLYYFPRDYEDRACSFDIATLPHGQRAGARAVVSGGPKTKRIRRGFTLTQLPIFDGTAKGFAIWFNNPYAARKLEIGKEYDFFGRIEGRMGEPQIQNPKVSKGGTDTYGYKGTIAPIYSQQGRLRPGDFERMLSKAITASQGAIHDIFPKDFRDEYGLENMEACIKNIHFPEDMKSLEKARYRLVFEELFILQFGLLLIKKEQKHKNQGTVFMPVTGERDILNALPFCLTDAQKRVWTEIKNDMESDRVMNRLLQGDVGSGKTVIAALALVKAAQNGFQGALMVPTEILAKQHLETLKDILSTVDLRIELLTGGCSASQRERIYNNISNGDTDIIIGTHSLIQEGIGFKNLGLVITDEQHRFGVRQRFALAEKGKTPDILVMTATPIPRSLALILYGDMDLSIIDEMPPGRKEIATYVIGEKERDRAYGFVEEQLAKGHQAYVICPLIENTDSVEARSAVCTHLELEERYSGKYKVKLLHGRIAGDTKEQIMRDFNSGKINLLVSTTVVEVGVDIPNANILVVENAERFGLAQLHQLRGRVGRGGDQSYCVLISQSRSEASYNRMRVLAKSSDGFYISEKDLQLRGPGEFFGIKQHGLPEFNIVRLPRDIATLKTVQSAIFRLLKQQDTLKKHCWERLICKIKDTFNAIGMLIDVI